MRLRPLPLRGLLLILALGCLLPIAGVLIWDALALRRAREAEVNDLSQRYAELAAAEIRQVFAGVEHLLIALDAVPGVGEDAVSRNDAACMAYLHRVGAKLDFLIGLVVIGTDGRMQCSSSGGIPDANFSDRPYFQQALNTGRFTIGTYTIGRATGRPTLPLAAPARGRNGEIVGIMVAALDLSWFGARLKERGLSKGGALTVADRNGVILAREPFSERFIGTRIPEPYMRLVQGTARGSEKIMSQDGTPRVIGYIPATDPTLGLYVSAGLSQEEEFGEVNAARTRRLAGLAALGVAVFLAAFLIGRRTIQQPVERILFAIRAWQNGDTWARTAMRHDGGDLAALGWAFDRLLDEIATRQEERQRADAHRELLLQELKHRVKNTLSVVQAIAHQSFRQGADAALAQKSFSERLQALARAHDMLTSTAWHSADLRDVVESAVQPLPAMRVQVSGANMRIQPRAALALSMALHELATNAQKYGALCGDAGSVQIHWVLRRDGNEDRLCLTWKEHGGPAVAQPERSGFGSRLIERALAAELSGTARMQFETSGLVCIIDAPAASVLEGPVPLSAQEPNDPAQEAA